jgi:hypothetical protein
MHFARQPLLLFKATKITYAFLTEAPFLEGTFLIDFAGAVELFAAGAALVTLAAGFAAVLAAGLAVCLAAVAFVSCFNTGAAKESPPKRTTPARIALNFFMTFIVFING